MIIHDHRLAITDLNWSPGNFLVTSSLDCSVRLYHVNTQVCLCVFRHTDCVSSACFHPINESLFLTGCVDGRTRVWSIPEKKVVSWNESYDIPITAVAFTKDGSTIIVGTVTGLCIFYDFIGLKYITQIQITGTRAKPKDGKITGIENMPNTIEGEEKILITSTDSRVTLINVNDRSIFRKYKGCDFKSGRLFANFSFNAQYILCGTDDRHVVIWDTTAETYHQQFSGILSGVLQWQSDSKASCGQEKLAISQDPITFALFAPWPCIDDGGKHRNPTNPTSYFGDHATHPANNDGIVVIVADIYGRIRVFENSLAFNDGGLAQPLGLFASATG